MRYKIYLLLPLFFLSISCIVYPQELNDKLKFLTPMLSDNWAGEMKSPDGKKSFNVSLKIESTWNGNVVKYTRAVPDLKFFKEGYFYFDENTNRVLFFSITSGGDGETAEVVMEEGKISIKGQLTMNNKTFDYKNVWEFPEEGKMTDRWLQNSSGSWRQGHVIVFQKAK